MKLSLNFEKRKKNQSSHSKSHNQRLRETESQLPKAAWFTKDGHHTVMPWRDDVLTNATALAKRKDAVVAINVVMQVGSQDDWRHLPDEDNPFGAPKASEKRLKALMAGAKEAAIAAFGADNIVGMDLHTDESTPHIHCVVVPVKDGKLQAKAWLDGPASLVKLREQMCASMNQHIRCDYEKGAPGGKPHDVSLRAGSKPPEPEASIWQKIKAPFDKVSELKAALEKAHEKIAKLVAERKQLFSKLKAATRTATDRYDAMRKAQAESNNREKEILALKEKQAELLRDSRQQNETKEREIEHLRNKVVQLENKLNPPEPKPKAKEPELAAAPKPKGMSLG